MSKHERKPGQRTPVVGEIARLLAESGRTEAGSDPYATKPGQIIGYTHRALAERVYGTSRPTPAQLSAVRRAVAKLVAEGQAWRLDWHRDAWSASPAWRIDSRARHRRTKASGRSYLANSALGVTVFRTPSDEDVKARPDLYADWGKASEVAELRGVGLTPETLAQALALAELGPC
jgi:hypothetical protein